VRNAARRGMGGLSGKGRGVSCTREGVCVRHWAEVGFGVERWGGRGWGQWGGRDYGTFHVIRARSGA